jgi:long-subunit acyl-CoA synthetase (AMP-forming)
VARLGLTVKQGWGMSELSPLGTVELDHHPDHPGSVGPPCANTCVKARSFFFFVRFARLGCLFVTSLTLALCGCAWVCSACALSVCL